MNELSRSADQRWSTMKDDRINIFNRLEDEADIDLEIALNNMCFT